MRRRHPLPAGPWLMTDERQGDSLWHALAALPRGAAVIFRHHATPARERRALYDRARAIARRRGLVLLVAGSPRLAIAWQADGAHGRSPHRRAARRLIRTAPAHDSRELAVARRAEVDAALLSPVFATRSHPGARVLGPLRFAAHARRFPLPLIALGGMTRTRAWHLKALGAAGWAAIDGLADYPGRQPRSCWTVRT